MLTDDRKEAVRRATREIAALTAARTAPATFKPGTPVVVALHDETIDEVMARVTAYPPPVLLAVYYPGSASRLELVTLQTGRRSDEPQDDAIKVSGSATIGMVIDAGSLIAMPGQWDEIYKAERLTPTPA